MEKAPRQGTILEAELFSLSFETAIADVEHLLELHDVENRRKHGHSNPYLEVLKRAGIILTVTTWETFIEDALEEAVRARLDRAQDPKEMIGTFNAVATDWLNNKGNVKPPNLLRWTQDGWKSVIGEQFHREIARLNSPHSRHIMEITKRYLSHDLTQAWHWQRCPQTLACKRLDNLIKRRGALVHRSRDILEVGTAVNRDYLVSSIDLLKHLVERTEKALGFKRREVLLPDTGHAET
jgi:hypothetical protein